MNSLNIDNLCSYLNISLENRKMINETLNKISNLEQYKKLFFENENEFFKRLDNEYPNDYLVVLSMYLEFALTLYKNYKIKAIDESIFYDTINDIGVWIEECKKETKLFGLKEKYWLTEHLHMRLFKLGRLQFQKRNEEDDLLEFNLNFSFDKSNTYYVHIPRGESLKEDLIKDSLRRALDFYHKDEMNLLCESWLLSPNLKNVLEEDTNILKFAKMFKVSRFDNTSRSIHRYLDVGSRLEKKVKDYEKKGQNIGTGYGYLKIKRGDLQIEK